MPHQTEPSASNALGILLRGMLGQAAVRSENTRLIEGNAALQPDILVTAPGRSPVVVEAEYDPADNIEPEARERLGLKVVGQPRPIEAAVALRYPEAVGDASDLDASLRQSTLHYCVFTAEDDRIVRFPESGWPQCSCRTASSHGPRPSPDCPPGRRWALTGKRRGGPMTGPVRRSHSHGQRLGHSADANPGLGQD